MWTVGVIGVLAVAGVAFAPASQAGPYMLKGNYDIRIPDRYDFHTWIWTVSPCVPFSPECVKIQGVPQPIAKAFQWNGDARPGPDGRYTLTVDVPDGLRCDNIYYGPVIPTHDVYTWDPVTLAGTLVSSFDVNCGNQPGGSYTYPFNLIRM